MTCVAGVDIGGTKILAGAINAAGEVLGRARRPTPPKTGTAAELCDAIAAAVADLVAMVDSESVSRVGIGIAAFVNAERTHAMFAPHLALRAFPLKDELEKRLDLPVVIENDANAAIWAEKRFGAARGQSDVLGVTVGTGLGGALIAGGHLQRGRNGMAGEFGHTQAVPDGLPCSCGLRGCLEQYASGGALTRAGQALVARLGQAAGMLHALAEGDPQRVTGPIVSEAARAGDPAALDLFVDLGSWLGVGLASAANAVDPEVIVVGGGLSEVSDLFLPQARVMLARGVSGHGFRELPEMCVAALGQDAGFLGAADLALTGG